MGVRGNFYGGFGVGQNNFGFFGEGGAQKVTPKKYISNVAYFWTVGLTALGVANFWNKKCSISLSINLNELQVYIRQEAVV